MARDVSSGRSPQREATAPFDLGAWLAALSGPPPIVQAGASVLRLRAQSVPSSLLATPALRELAGLMTDVMHRAPGVGLAAPQIGVPLRVFVAEDLQQRIDELPAGAAQRKGRVALPLTVLVNPKLEPDGPEQLTFFEGCLSVRGYGALVPRWRAVRVSGVDTEGRPLALRVEGWPARIMQHELDHLDGTLYVDRMLSRSFANEAELPRLGALSLEDAKRELGLE